MRKLLILCLLAVSVGCTTQQKVTRKLKQENRFTKQFQEADKEFDKRYNLKIKK